MKNGKKPDPNVIHPIAGYDKEIYVKPTIGTIFFALLIAFLLVGCKAKDSKPSPEINPIRALIFYSGKIRSYGV